MGQTENIPIATTVGTEEPVAQHFIFTAAEML